MNALHLSWRDDSGATMVEYGIIIAMVVLATIVAWQALGGTLTGLLTEVGGYFA